MKRFAGAFSLVLTLAAADSAVADSPEVTAVITSVGAGPAAPSFAERLAIIRERIWNALGY
jgi:hypothetical protein